MGTTGMALMVGQWFARYISGKVMDKMADKALSSSSDKDNMLVDVKAMLKKVEDRLPHIQAVIHAAEGKPIKSQVLANWLKEVKDAAYEADDILDDFEFRELQELQDSGKVAAFASSALRFLKNLFVSDDELKRLKDLVGDLDEIFLDIDCKTAELDEYSAKEKCAARETSSFVQEEVIGRDEERDKILEIILLHAEDEPDFGDKGAGSSSYPSLGVLPIVGIGGVGKTTLAQVIYNDPRVANLFKRKWVYVSDDFKLRRILKELIYDSPIGTLEDISSDVMLMKLKDDIRNKKFLFVLDDVWDETGNTWKELVSALTMGARGSIILVTTQSPKVAEIMGTMDPIQLEPLEDNDFWRLLKHFVFGDEELNSDSRIKLELIGQEISNKLHGLPLAGKAVGSLLRTRLDEQFWRKILESEWWEEDFVVDNILPSLGLSYQHLSSHLKQCFAYASIFPKGYVFQKERLVQMWMAQGFIQSKLQGRMSFEDLGCQMFEELANRYFFLSKQDGGYVMHDLIRELAVCVSLDECFVVNDEPAEIPATVRHLTLTAAKLDAVRELQKLRKVRTIIFFHDYNHKEFYGVLENILKDNKSLRVLDFSNSHMGIKKLPDALCELSHLRYLDISGTRIRQLPRTLSRLCHLQVLNLERCDFLNKLPEGMNRLSKLRYLYAKDDMVSLVDGIGKLTDLQELKEFRVMRKRGHQIGELKDLRNLRRRLYLKSLENVDSREEAAEVKLKDKEHLDKLWLFWNAGLGIQGRDIIEGLEPHYNLKDFSIEHYGGVTFPSWLVMNQRLTNLEVLFLRDCAKCDSLPPLGRLPFLRALDIQTMPAVKRIGAEFYGDADPVFPSLEELRYVGLDNWEEWCEADGRQFLPRLRLLKIEGCMKLRKVPLVHLNPSVKELSLYDCGDIGSELHGCLQILTSLLTLEVYGWAHRTFLCLSNLSDLLRLELRRCPELRLHGGIRFLTNLENLLIEKCPNLFERSRLDQPDHNEHILASLSSVHTDQCLLDNVWMALGRVPSLRELDIFSCSGLDRFKFAQEEWLRQLTSLDFLKIGNCIDLLSLPSSLATMSSIKRLEIRYNPKIQSLPEDGLPMSLKELKIVTCPTLKERCAQQQGPDWMKIAHIPYINIDGQEIIQIPPQQHQE